MFVCRSYLALLNIILRSIIFWQSPPPLGGSASPRANLFLDRATSHGLFSTEDFLPSRIQPLSFLLHLSTGARLLFINLSVHGIYLHASVADETRGGSIFLLSFQSCPVPFRSFHSRTGSSINHRISLTLVLFFRGSFADVDIAKSSLLGRDWFFFFLCIVSLGRVSVPSK